MYQHEMTVRFNDCDAMGHLNNAVYYTFFEEARKELFQIFNPELNTHRWNLIVASNSCDFLQQAVYAETLTIYTWISRLGKSSFEVEHAMKNEQGVWVARGRATLLGFDFEQQKAAPLTEAQREALLAHSEGPADAPAQR
jgi:acyl-CoA thioester hydrolase